MPGPRPTHKQVSPTKLRAAYMRPLQAVKNPTPSSTCTRFCRFAIFAKFRNHSCSFLQRKIPYRGTDFHIQNCAAHDRSALRNRESAIAAPLFRQLPQWSNLLRHDTLRMTKFVCSAVPLPSAGSTHPQAAGPACKEENHGKKRNRWSVRRPHLGHQRKPGRRI